MVAHFDRNRQKTSNALCGLNRNYQLQPVPLSRNRHAGTIPLLSSRSIFILPRNTRLYFSFRCKPFLSPINLLHETFSSLCSHIAFGLPDINCVAKVLVMPFLYARSKPDGSRQNLHLRFARVVFNRETLHKEL